MVVEGFAEVSLQNLFASVLEVLEAPQMEIPFPQYSKSNEPPAEAEIPLLKQFIDESKPIIESLDAVISGIDKVQSHLRQRRDQCHTALNQQRSALSAIRRLPSEILAIIFQLCVNEFDLDFMGKLVFGNQLDPKLPPWIFGRVCRSWRQVCFGTSVLWERINLGDTSLRLAHNVKRLEDFLLHSSPLPLTIDFKIPVTTLDPSNVPAFYNAVIPHLSRTRKLFLHNLTDEGLLTLTNYASGKFESLRVVSVILSGRDSDFEDVPTSKVFNHVSNLAVYCKATRRGTHPAVITSLNRFGFPGPWPNLTHFRGSMMPLTYLSVVLRSAPNLASCKIRNMRMAAAPGIQVMHERLRALHLSGLQPAIFPALFRYTQLPSLASLHLPNPSMTDEAAELLELFVTPMSSSLKELSLKAPIPPQYLESVLDCCSAITILDLGSISDQTLSRLILPVSASSAPISLPLLPVLRRFIIQSEGCRVPLIQGLIKSRTFEPSNTFLSPLYQPLAEVRILVDNDTCRHFYCRLQEPRLDKELYDLLFYYAYCFKKLEGSNDPDVSFQDIINNLKNCLSPNEVLLLRNFGALNVLKRVASFASNDDLRQEARSISKQWESILEEFDKTPHWRMSKEVEDNISSIMLVFQILDPKPWPITTWPIIFSSGCWSFLGD